MRVLTPARITLLMLVTVGGLVAAYVAKGLNASDDPAARLVERDGPGRRLPAGIGKPPQPSPASEGEYVSAPLEVAEGMRAVSILLDAKSDLVDGRIAPGQHVDVHLTPRVGDGSAGRSPGGMAVTLLKGVKVLAMNAAATGKRESDRYSVTLELTPRQANIVVLAEQYGSLKLSYNPDPVGETAVSVGRDDRATLEEILGTNRPQPSEPPRMQPPRIEPPQPQPPRPQPPPVESPPRPSHSRGFVAESYRGTRRTEVRFGK